MEDKVETCKTIGNKLFAEKDYSTALKYYREGLKIDSSHPQLNCNASAAAYQLGLYNESEEYALRAIEKMKNYEKAYFRAIKAAEANESLYRQLDYLIQGMKNCDSCKSLILEGERIERYVVNSTFFDPSLWETLLSAPAAQKFSQMEELMRKIKMRQSNLPKRAPDVPPCGHRKAERRPSDLADFFAEFKEVPGVKFDINGRFPSFGDDWPHKKRSVFFEINDCSITKENRKFAAPAQNSVPPTRTEILSQKTGTAKENRSGSKSTQPPPAPVSDKAKLNTPAKRDASEQRGVKNQRTDSVGSNGQVTPAKRDASEQRGVKNQRTDCSSTSDQVYSKESRSGISITEEIMTLLKKGREAFKNSFYPLAATYLVKAQTQLKVHALEDVEEFALCKVPLTYVICEAKVGCGEYKDIVEGIQMLRKLVEEQVSRKFPAVLYLLGFAFFKLNRFKEAREQLDEVNSLIKNNVNFNTYPWPGTFDVINATQKSYLETVVKDLLRECRPYHKPNWICLFKDCEKINTHIIPSRNIYFNDPDFSGYVELSCVSKCSLIFHRHCWKAFKEQQKIKRLTDKEILGEPCLTPDCIDSTIIGIKIFDKDGKITHQHSIPFEKPVQKENVKGSKTSEKCSGVPRQGGAVKVGSGVLKQKTLGGFPSQKTSCSEKRATDEASGNIGSEEKEIDFEAELKIIKQKLDYIRSSDKRWLQFNIEAPITSQFELTGQEWFVESFVEEVLKDEGPLHLCQLEDVFRKNKIIFENALPSVRTFDDFLQFLLEQSHHFVLMDSLIGLAADVADMYRTTKDNINTRLKSSSKVTEDTCLSDRLVITARSDAGASDIIHKASTNVNFGASVEANLTARTKSDTNIGANEDAKEQEAINEANTFVPYKKTVFGPECEKNHPVVPRPKYESAPPKRSPEDSIFSSSSAGLQYPPSSKVPIPLPLAAFIKPKDLRVKDKKNLDSKLATRERNKENNPQVGKSKKDDSSRVQESYISGVLSVLMEKNKEKNDTYVAVSDNHLFKLPASKIFSSSKNDIQVTVCDEQTSALSSASLDESISTVNDGESASPDGVSPTANQLNFTDRSEFEPVNESSLEIPVERKLSLFDVVVSSEEDQRSLVEKQPEEKPVLSDYVVNRVFNKEDQLSLVEKQPEEKPVLSDYVVNRVFNKEDQLSLVEKQPEEKPMLSDYVVNRAVNEKDQVSSRVITNNPSGPPILKKVKSFLEAAFRNTQLQLNNVGKNTVPVDSLKLSGDVDPLRSDIFKSIPNSAQTSDTETVNSGSYKSVPNEKKPYSEISYKADITKSENPSSEDNCSYNSAVSGDDFVSENAVLSLDSSFGEYCKDANSACTEESKYVLSKDMSGSGLKVTSKPEDFSGRIGEVPSTITPSADLPEDVLFVDVSSLPVVESEKADSFLPIPPPSSPVSIFERIADSKPAAVGKDLILKEGPLFEEGLEDLFIIDDKDKRLIGDISPLDLPRISDLVWDDKNLLENGDLFAVEPSKNLPEKFDNLFQVSRPNSATDTFSSGLDLFQTNEEKQQGASLETNNNRWQPSQAVMDYIRLSFPRQNYSYLIEGLAELYDKKGTEVSKMGSEEIVKELAEIFQLTQCLQNTYAGEGPPEKPSQEIQSTEVLKDAHCLDCEVSPWKPPVLLVQVVRLSFPTEEFYKLMFALYLAKLYSDTTRFDELCDGVATFLNYINEGKCQDYNYEISKHGPYNEESRIIYEKAWRMLIKSRPETGHV